MVSRRLDPADPDMVLASQRTGSSGLHNRRTGQTTTLGPDMSGRGADGGALNRNVRTMPIAWSPVNPDVLFYASNAVWKTADHGHSWMRTQPLTRRGQTWVHWRLRGSTLPV